MGNCFSSGRRQGEVPTAEGDGNPNRLSLTLTSVTRKFRGEGEDSERSIMCGTCHRSCGYGDGRSYLKCLECSNDFNLCDRCHTKDWSHPGHVYAYVDNEERHSFIETIAQRMEGWPILTQVPFSERRPLYPIKCFNLKPDGDLHSRICPNPVSWICLQCPAPFSLCQSCMDIPFPHTRHVFAMAKTRSLQNFVVSQQNSGMLPLKLQYN